MPPIANPDHVKTISLLALGKLMDSDDAVGIHLRDALHPENHDRRRKCEARGNRSEHGSRTDRKAGS